jgi:hypothetical protein
MKDTAKLENTPIADLNLEIEELEKIVAPMDPGIDRIALNHNETLVGDEETEWDA